MNNTFALKGNIIYSEDKNTLYCAEKAYLVCEAGKVCGVFAELPEQYKGVAVTDYGEKLIIPGLTDMHVHAPQYTYRSLGMDLELLPWLNTYAFPEEARYAQEAYAQKAYGRFAAALLNGATTRASIFATLHTPATRILMDLVEKSGVKAYIGKVNMDRNSPDNLRETAEESAQATEQWICACKDTYSNVKPILTPRFIPSCTDELMKKLGEIQRKYNLPMQSHLSENRSEIAWVSELHPDTKCYGEAYQKYGMFGGDCPTIMAHCVHPNEIELDLMDKNGVYIAHCPQSNMNLSSGVAPIRTYLERGMNVGMGSDVAGGADLSIFKAMADAIRASKLRWTLLDNSLAPLTVPEVFYMATKGGGAFWGKVGSFEPDYEFDAVVLDDSAIDGWEEFSVAQRLERFIYLADDRDVCDKYVAGVKVK